MVKRSSPEEEQSVVLCGEYSYTQDNFLLGCLKKPSMVLLTKSRTASRGLVPNIRQNNNLPVATPLSMQVKTAHFGRFTRVCTYIVLCTYKLTDEVRNWYNIYHQRYFW